MLTLNVPFALSQLMLYSMDNIGHAAPIEAAKAKTEPKVEAVADAAANGTDPTPSA